MEKNAGNNRHRFLIFFIVLFLNPFSLVHAFSEVQTSAAGLSSKVAPGELLPLSVKLLNFGSSNRVDVLIDYTIVDLQGAIIYKAEETVAVETTAQFVKTIQIPFETPPGQYIAKSSILYQDQVTPATTEFPFRVEIKILGLFKDDFYLYAGIIILVSFFTGIFIRILARRSRVSRTGPIDYSHIPKSSRIFYELISDTVMGMRQQVGERALEIALQTPGLLMEKSTGEVLKLTKKPSKVLAELVEEYESLLNKKVSFSFRPQKRRV